ncbi:MAG: hypothetical protein ACI9Y1_000129 [Lentisphaeria bacterium]|jgi:hypothetical protein
MGHDSGNPGAAVAEIIKGFMDDPEIWIGMVIAAAFLLGAIWFRNNRYEI